MPTHQGVQLGLAAFLALCILHPHKGPVAELIFTLAMAAVVGWLVAIAV